MQQIPAPRQNLFARGDSGQLALVLDTNVVLDLLVFEDRHCSKLCTALATGRARWHATPRMRAEFELVLARPSFAGWKAHRAQVATGWATWATMIEPLEPSSATPRCRDPDDQMFLDLATQLGPCHLLSRDTEVLRLKRPAAQFGVHIATPAEFEPL
jgi:predicted nucleic acid-binding protein